MAEKSSDFESVVHAITIASRYPAHALSDEHHQSFPVPVKEPSGVKLVFLYCKASIPAPGAGLQLMVPSYLAVLDAKTSLFEELRAVVPSELGLSQKEGEVLPGRARTTTERMVPEQMTKELRFLQSLDALLPAFAAGKDRVDPDVAAAARVHKSLFAEVTESPLTGCYQKLGAAFFAWRDKAAA